MNRLRGRWAGAPILFIIGILLIAWPKSDVIAQGKIYFPQTGHFLGGAFRSFWEQNGGVEIFGYPVSPEFVQNRDGRVAQYFERARFELDVVNNQAVISLGLIGREYTAARGLGFPPVAPIHAPGLRYFPETGHTLRGEFLNFWNRRGGLRIFGYPISEEFVQQLEDGRNYTVQYFERARFELVGNRVRLGLLGSALVPCQLRPGFPSNAPPAAPVPEGSSEACTLIPGFASRVFPETSAPGTTLGFEARGYIGGEEVAMWLNLPTGGVRAIPYRAVADPDGVVLIGFRTLATDPPGFYSIVGQGLRSGRVNVAPFRLVR